MKTLELDLKKRLLIVDLPNEKCEFTGLIGNDIFYYDEQMNLEDYPLSFPLPYDCEFICKGSELTEEVANELVEKSNFQNHHKEAKINYKNHNGIFSFHTAKQSFISAIEAKGFYWLENPIQKPKFIDYSPREIENDNSKFWKLMDLWQEAEPKTFKNPLIFEIL